MSELRTISSRAGLFLELAIVLGAFALRVYRLDAPGFEVDEAHSMRFVAMGYGGILTTAMTIEPHPPLFYFVLRTWYLLVGANEAALRFPALLANVLAIPVLVRLTERLGWHSAGLLAAALFAFNPYQLYYAQNARMYGFIVLFAPLALLFGVRFVERGTWRDALGCALAVLIVLFTHYYGIFHALFIGAFVLIALIAARAPRERVRRWIGIQVVVGTLLLVWLGASYRVSVYFERATQKGVDASLLWDIARDALPKHSLGVALPEGFDARWSIVFLAVLMVGLAYAGRRGRLFAPWLRVLMVGGYLATPLVLGFAVSLVRIMYEARYFMASAPAFFLLLGLGLVGLFRVQPVIGATAGLLLVGAQAASVVAYFDESRYIRAEFAVGYAYVHAHLRPGDGIILNCDDQITQFNYYHTLKYADPTPFYVLPGDARDPAALAGKVDEIMAAQKGVWFLDYGGAACDADHVVERALATRHYPALYLPLGRHRIAYYASREALSTEAAPIEASCSGDLMVAGARRPSAPVHPGDLLPLSLDIRALRETRRAYATSWRLLDGDGHVVNQHDSQPDAGFAPSYTWKAGQTVVDRHGLPVPTSALPGRYRVAVGVYDTGSGERCGWQVSGKTLPDQLLDIGPVEVLAGPVEAGIVAPSPRHRLDAGTSGVRLLGYDVDAGPFVPGGAIPLRLLWRAESGPRPDYRVVAALLDEKGSVLGRLERPLGVGYPTSQWAAGRLAETFLDVPVPPRASRGNHTVQLSLAGPASTEDLGSVAARIAGRERNFTAPPGSIAPLADFGGRIQLLQADLTSPAADGQSPGSAIQLGLTWRAANEVGVGYKVFTHLVGPDGKTYGQDDSIPQRGAAPTNGWMSGEIVVDRYTLPLASDAPNGQYRVEVGFYDPATNRRLPLVGAAGDSFTVGSVKVEGARAVVS